MSRRTEMIGSTLQKELMMMIMRDLADPRLGGLPSITRVEVAADLSTADVFVTIMGTEGKQQLALNALKHSAGMMRQKLNKSLPMRTIPFLKFHIDDKLKKELAVLELIAKAKEEEDQRSGRTRATEPTYERTSRRADHRADYRAGRRTDGRTNGLTDGRRAEH